MLALQLQTACTSVSGYSIWDEGDEAGQDSCTLLSQGRTRPPAPCSHRPDG